LFSVYDIFFTENFNPNSRSYHLFEKGLFKLHLPNQLNRLCRKFNARRLLERVETVRMETEKPESTPNEQVTVHQCPHCFTVYDEQYGDARHGVAAGTAFADLPIAYTCSTCDAPKHELRVAQVDKTGAH
jgi:rubredoxin